MDWIRLCSHNFMEEMLLGRGIFLSKKEIFKFYSTGPILTYRSILLKESYLI